MKVKYCLVDKYQKKDRENVLLEDSQPDYFTVFENLKIGGIVYSIVSVERDIERVASMGNIIIEHTLYVHLRSYG